MERKYRAIHEAVTAYPTLKTTVKKCQEQGITIMRHMAEYTKRGAVSAHWIRVKWNDGTEEWVRNQWLLSRIKIFNP